MPTDITPKKTTGTYELLERVAPNLYRHRINRTYYGIKKVNGNRKSHALGPQGRPTMDRKLADRFLREWLASLDQTDASKGDMTLDKLLVRFAAVRAGMKKGTLDADAACVARFRTSFPRPMTTLAARVDTTDLVEWLRKLTARNGKPLRHSTYNRYRQFLADLFQIAVIARVVTKKTNPLPRRRRSSKKRPARRARDSVGRPIRGLDRRNPQSELG